jgi:hypothetical protein
MTKQRLLRWLEADRDGELRGWRRWWVRRALARSPALRVERLALDAIRGAVREAEADMAPPGLWEGLEPALDAIDRESARSAPATSPGRSGAPAFWWPAGAALGAAVLAGVLFWALHEGGAPLPAEVASGHMRSLDTGGRAVWVQESDEATIIWLVGDENDAV